MSTRHVSSKINYLGAKCCPLQSAAHCQLLDEERNAVCALDNVLSDTR